VGSMHTRRAILERSAAAVVETDTISPHGDKDAVRPIFDTPTRAPVDGRSGVQMGHLEKSRFRPISLQNQRGGSVSDGTPKRPLRPLRAFETAVGASALQRPLR